MQNLSRPLHALNNKKRSVDDVKINTEKIKLNEINIMK